MTRDEIDRILDAAPAHLREQAAEHLVEQAERLETLRKLVAEGIADADAGRVDDWSLDEFLALIEADDEQAPLRRA